MWRVVLHRHSLPVAALLSLLDDADTLVAGMRRVLHMDDANVQRLLNGALPIGLMMLHSMEACLVVGSFHVPRVCTGAREHVLAQGPQGAPAGDGEGPSEQQGSQEGTDKTQPTTPTTPITQRPPRGMDPTPATRTPARHLLRTTTPHIAPDDLRTLVQPHAEVRT